MPSFFRQSPSTNAPGNSTGRKNERLRRAVHWLIIGTLVIIAMMVFASFTYGPWLCDLCTQFRLAYLPVLSILLLLSTAVRAWRTALACITIGAINAIPIFALYGPANCPPATKQSLQIAILNFNTEFQHNSNYDALRKLVKAKKPDIIALVEVDHKWTDSLDDLKPVYPYSRIVIEGAGIALFSRFPLQNIEVRHFGRSHHPRIIASFAENGHSVNVLLAHPTTPRSQSAFYERNEELAVISKELLEMKSPKILIGDLNCGPWSGNFQQLLAVSGLRDSQQGRGPQPSWPARTGRVLEHVPIPPLIPIDHVLVSDGVCVLDRTVGPAMNSDHLPVFVRAAINK